MRIAGEVLLAVVNSLWQAALVATLVWAALRFAKRMNAATRYAIWWAVLGVSLALPAAPQVVAWWHARAQTTVTVTANRQAAKRVETPLMEEPPAMVVLPEERLARWPLWVAGLWAALCAYRLGQIVRSYFYLRGVKKRAVLAPTEVAPQGLAGASRSTRLLLSKDVLSPMAVGFLHPAVILPEGLPEELAPAEIEHVLLHESAHIARRDDWSNLLAKTVGAGLALHPVAWWILRQIERGAGDRLRRLGGGSGGRGKAVCAEPGADVGMAVGAAGEGGGWAGGSTGLGSLRRRFRFRPKD